MTYAARPWIQVAGHKVVALGKRDPCVRSVRLIQEVCARAGALSLFDDIADELDQAGVVHAIARGKTPQIFDWLLTNFAFQGISDQAARTYMEQHGTATWSQIAKSLEQGCSCRKLRSYWQYNGCRYDKGSGTCAEPEHIDDCPVPRFRLRNGRLNQTAYSFFLFVRDVADGDVVGWIDNQLRTATATSTTSLLSARQEALIGPLRHVYGVSDKILGMTLSNLLIAAGAQRPMWFETGTAMLAIDSLVHAFLHRTGILLDCGSAHLYGPACYAAGGCADIIRTAAKQIDARRFNPKFPAEFPRFVQHAIWRFCAADGLNVCNGNQIDDRYSCRNAYCQVGHICARERLKT